MQRRTFFAGLGIATLGLPAPSAIAWDLVSPNEEQQEDLITPPTIEVIRPDPAKPISSPVTIQIAFRTQPGASILPSTFEATYGFLGLDITSRLLQHATLTPQGITAEDVSIPPGQPKGSPNFVPPAERIAEFDQDGTLWVEHPVYTQIVYCLDHVGTLAKEKPELKATAAPV